MKQYHGRAMEYHFHATMDFVRFGYVGREAPLQGRGLSFVSLKHAQAQ
jgi:hypothetical protein